MSLLWAIVVLLGVVLIVSVIAGFMLAMLTAGGKYLDEVPLDDLLNRPGDDEQFERWTNERKRP